MDRDNRVKAKFGTGGAASSLASAMDHKVRMYELGLEFFNMDKVRPLSPLPITLPITLPHPPTTTPPPTTVGRTRMCSGTTWGSSSVVFA
jgi:hypothetical protein